MATLVITGATTGIGGAIARRLVADGDTVVLQYHRNRDACTAVAEELESRNAAVAMVQADFASDPREGAETVARVVREHIDSLDVLINNAGGIIARQKVEEAKYAVIERTINLNLLGPMALTSALAPLLKRNGRGDVINITSIAARSAVPTSTSYAAAKAGLESYTRGAAKAFAPSVRVNAVAPGVIDTPFHQGKTPQDQMDAWLKNTPVGHHGKPEDVALAVSFILESDFMTGAVIPVNGGMLMT